VTKKTTPAPSRSLPRRAASLLLRAADRVVSPVVAKVSAARGTRGRGGALAHQKLLAQYRVANLVTNDKGEVPVGWWVLAPNFGDLLSPWLIGKMTDREVVHADPLEPHYLAIGSIAKRATKTSIVWGSGSFGTEPRGELEPEARYTAVRGPLTRSRLRHFKADVPAVYGDPALLAPFYYFPEVEVEHEVGIVLRWSERNRAKAEFGPGVLPITLETDDIEGTIKAMLSCRRIVTSSLHGLIISDAYGIPSAWISSSTPKGGEFKYYDYFATVNKFRTIQRYGFGAGSAPVTVARVLRKLRFDDAAIEFDYEALLDACPFLERTTAKVVKTRAAGEKAQGD